jgi:glycosyltransferase involved in cell wall biosynthesis
MVKNLHLPAGRIRGGGASVGVVSTYPPTTCGLATFTASLVRHLRASPAAPAVGVIQVSDTPLATASPDVVGHFVSRTPGAASRAARALEGTDFTILQHEYGIYGGPCGEEVLDLLAAISAPTVVVTHTVLSDPSPRQRAVLSAVAAAADVVVSMTGVARERLVDRYDVDPAKVIVIPHGAIVEAHGRVPLSSGRPRLLTWGLLGPGKGIEWTIDALALLPDLAPRPRYLVAGQTHPRVREHAGEAYRESLKERAAALGVGDIVAFDGRYRPHDSLLRLIRGADVVVLPYESTEQVTSGVLVDAIASGRPVVATAFPHAAELLESGAGLVVPHRDPEALAAALRTLLTEPGAISRMAREAARIAPSLAWGAVAERYLALGDRLRTRRVA